MSTDLQKLTVPQLRALCKEKGITGYSKLAKSALIEKLTTHGKRPPLANELVAKSGHIIQPQEKLSDEKQKKKEPSKSAAVQSAVKALVVEKLREPDPIELCQERTNVSIDSGSLPDSGNDQGSLQLAKTTTEAEPPLKKQKTKLVLNQSSLTIKKSIQEPKTNRRTVPLVIEPSNKQKRAHIPREKAVASNGKRYVPLVIQPKQPIVSTEPEIAVAESRITEQSVLSRYYLDFPVVDESKLVFKTITFPPSISQRRSASKLAIVLRDIRREDIPNMALTCRLFRYSAYLSAGVYLKRWYPGKRLDEVLKEVSVDRMSLWCYKVLRDDEFRERREVFRRSLVGKLVGGDLDVVAEDVWKSGDNAREAVIAIRFLLTRCYFSLSLNQSLSEMRRYKVVEAQEVVAGEIWEIVVRTRDSSQGSNKFYALEATGEIIGSPVTLDSQMPTRMDWSGYIQKHGCNVMDLVRWTNHEEYDRGISKIWLKKTREEEDGETKRKVARRYILACTMEHSLSGRYMNWNEMEQELRGLPRSMPGVQISKEQRVNLFVPAHHHVESVHFTTASGRSLHTALGVIQTPGREYYVLKDNGMQVGCEEEGIAEVWMEAIGCSRTGEA